MITTVDLPVESIGAISRGDTEPLPNHVSTDQDREINLLQGAQIDTEGLELSAPIVTHSQAAVGAKTLSCF
jgi:hypothetical protein